MAWFGKWLAVMSSIHNFLVNGAKTEAVLFGERRNVTSDTLKYCCQFLAPELGHKDVGLEIVSLPISLRWQGAAYSNRLKI